MRGKALCDQLAEPQEHPGALFNSMWCSDELGVPELRQEAAAAALGAEIVVFSLRGDTALSDSIKSWCEDWMPRPRSRELSIVVLFDPVTALWPAMEAARGYLREAAATSGIRFFGHAALTASVPFLGDPNPSA